MFQYKKSSIFFLCLVFFNPVASWQTRKKYKYDIKQLIDLLKRRNTLGSDESIIRTPESVEDLPRAEPIHPGHTLLQPSFGMLKSAVKYPHRDVSGTAVYGNLKNLGITHGKTSSRVLYTGFRKSNDILTKLLQALHKKINIRPKKSTNNLVIIELNPLLLKNINNQDADYSPAETNNNAIQILDDPNAAYEEFSYTRRQRKPRISEFRDRRSKEVSSSGKSATSSDTESSDYEHNAGNPFTAFKDKYKQNWLWNHFVDGHHMNINPHAPPFNSAGPSGAQLFFGRKWWYFNQDDFKPLN